MLVLACRGLPLVEGDIARLMPRPTGIKNKNIFVGGVVPGIGIRRKGLQKLGRRTGRRRKPLDEALFVFVADNRVLRQRPMNRGSRVRGARLPIVVAAERVSFVYEHLCAAIGVK